MLGSPAFSRVAARMNRPSPRRYGSSFPTIGSAAASATYMSLVLRPGSNDASADQRGDTWSGRSARTRAITRPASAPIRYDPEKPALTAANRQAEVVRSASGSGRPAAAPRYRADRL